MAKPVSSQKTLAGKPKRVAIVILTYNSERWLDSLLDSIFSAKLSGQIQVIIVDNNSRDSTLEKLQTYEDRVTLCRNQQNLGFARGCNIGIRQALAGGAEFVALLNDDLKVQPDWLEQLFASIAVVGPEGIFSPMQLNYDGVGLDPEMTRGIVASNQQFVDDLWNRRLKQSYIIPVAYFGCVLIHRSVFERVGLLDEVFFMYGEDEDFCRRANRNGIPIWLAPHSTVFHWNSAAQKNRSEVRTNVNDLTRLSVYILGLKNLERSFASRSIWFFKEIISRFVHGIVTGRWADAMNASKDGIRILRKLPDIYHSRNKDLEFEQTVMTASRAIK